MNTLQPQDPKLCFLLTLAGSPSVQQDTGLWRIFNKVILNISTFTKIDLSNSPSDGLKPTGLTNHRHAVLKLLYTLLLSDQSGKEGMLMNRQRDILNLFLCMVDPHTHCLHSLHKTGVPQTWLQSLSTLPLRMVHGLNDSTMFLLLSFIICSAFHLL